MKLEELIAVSGLPGLYKMAGNRPNGLIIEDLDSGKRKFASMRKHQFSPLETIAIFTTLDSVSLIEVLRKMHEVKVETPPVSIKADTSDLRAYFETIVPDHDHHRVYPKDIRKIIKWFLFLEERNLFDASQDEEE